MSTRDNIRPQQGRQRAAAQDADTLTLRNYSSRADLTPPGGRWWGTMLALIFCSGGATLLILAPSGVLRGVGVAFLFIGLIHIDSALQGFRMHAQGKRLQRQFGEAPWTHDYPWDPTGHSDGSHAMTVRYALAGISWFIACNGSLPLVLHLGAPIILISIVMFLISLLFLYFLTIKRVWHCMKFGFSRLKFGHAPYELGGSLQAELIPGSRIHYSKIQFTLRCIQPCIRQRTVRRHGRIQQESQTTFRQVHVDRVEFPDPGNWQPGLPPLAVSFELPDRSIPTNLSGNMAEIHTNDEGEPVGDGMRYWELQVRAFQDGLDYEASFLVPVYRASFQRSHTSSMKHCGGRWRAGRRSLWRATA